MRVRINAATPASIEVDGVIFNGPQHVDNFIKALQVAKNVVWRPEKPAKPEKKK